MYTQLVTRLFILQCERLFYIFSNIPLPFLFSTNPIVQNITGGLLFSFIISLI